MTLPKKAFNLMAKFGHGVLSIRESDSAPILSVPCKLQGRGEEGEVRVSVPAGLVPAREEAYPAGLCFHRHNEKLGGIGQQLCTGTAVVVENGEVTFRAEWQAGWDAPDGFLNRLFMGLITRRSGPRYFAKRPGPTPAMFPKPG